MNPNEVFPDPPMETGRIGLRPVEQGDYAFLYALLVSPPVGFHWMYHGVTPSPEEFVGRLWQSVLAQFTIEDSEGRPVGLTLLNNANLHSGFAYLSVACDMDQWGHGYGVDASVLTMNYAFTIWDLHKIYIEAPEFNLSLFGPISTYFDQEGILKDHLRLGSRYYDLHILGITRDRFEQLKADLPIAGRFFGSSSDAAVQAPSGENDDQTKKTTFSSLPEFTALVAEVLSVPAESLKPSTRLVSDLGIGSLGFVELLDSFESKLNIRIDDTAYSIETLLDAYAYCSTRRVTG